MKEGIDHSSNNYRMAEAITRGEIISLLETFWGQGSSIANYQQHIYSYHDARKLLDGLQTNNELDEGNLQKLFGGNLISFGVKESGKLIAHSGLLVQPWGEVEAVASIVSSESSGNKLMSTINPRRREILEIFAEHNFDLTTYAVIGSGSIPYVSNLFDFPKLGISSEFCNIGPYVYKRNLGMTSRKPSDILSSYSIEQNDLMLSHSTQVIGLNSGKLPYVGRAIRNNLSQVAQNSVNRMGFRPSILSVDNKVNTKYSSPAKIDIYVPWTDIADVDSFKKELLLGVMHGRSAIIRIPLIDDNTNNLKNIDNLFDLSSEYSLLFTGLSVVNGFWCACYSSIQKDNYEKYVNSLKVLKSSPEKSLSELATNLYTAEIYR